MAQYLNYDLDYMVEDYLGVVDFDNDEFGRGDRQRNDEGFDADDVKRKTDTLASEFRNGKDMQGIPWERFNYSRDKYREMRLKQYKNFENLSRPRVELENECKQLRNLLWATSKHDVYVMHNYSVMHWSSLLRRSKEVLNVAGQILPTQEPCGSLVQPLSRVQICNMCVKDNLMVGGGFEGELIFKNLNRPGVAFCTKVTSEENSITNSVDIYWTSDGSLRVTAANNDCNVRIFDAENFVLLNRLPFSWSVNNTSVSPNGKLLAVLGDSTECLLADVQTGKAIGELKGHLDYSFASAWHPDGRILATGNQDKTCRLWDVRNLSESLAVLKGQMGAIRGIKFSSDGRFMAMAEPADFVHVYDVGADYRKAQEIDLFGEIAGVSFSPDTEALFVATADRTYGSLLEFGRKHRYHYFDSCL